MNSKKHITCENSKPGFTIAELLISLALLGLISAFTIPKIISASQNSNKNAIFKECISSVAGVLDIGIKTGDLTPATNGDTYFLTHLNAVKICTTNSSTQGCWDTTIQGNRGEINEAGVILHNGATIVGFANTPNPEQGVLIDWNGLDGPNTEGDDQLFLGYCVLNTCGSGGWILGTGPKVLGSVGVDRNGNSTDIALFQSIYQ